MCVFIDEEGHVLETIKVEDLIDERSDIRKENDQRDGKVHPADGGILEFKQLISRRQPSVIVMGGFATRTHKLTKAVTAIAKSLAVETMETKGVAVDSVDYEASLADETLPVIYVPDNVARIFQHSARALKEFSTLPPTARYCVGLGRYAQSPMHEFCALGSDIVAITFDEYSQKLVSCHAAELEETCNDDAFPRSPPIKFSSLLSARSSTLSTTSGFASTMSSRTNISSSFSPLSRALDPARLPSSSVTSSRR